MIQIEQRDASQQLLDPMNHNNHKVDRITLYLFQGEITRGTYNFKQEAVLISS